MYSASPNEAKLILYIMKKVSGMLIVNLDIHDIMYELEISEPTFYRCTKKLLEKSLISYSEDRSNYWVHPVLFNPNIRLL